MITQERLRELIHYCPETGEFTHLESRGSVKAGTKASCPARDILSFALIQFCIPLIDLLGFMCMVIFQMATLITLMEINLTIESVI